MIFTNLVYCILCLCLSLLLLESNVRKWNYVYFILCWPQCPVWTFKHGVVSAGSGGGKNEEVGERSCRERKEKEVDR